MEVESTGSVTALDQIKQAFHTDNAAEVRRLFDLHPEFKALVNEPIGPFQSPAIANVRSREMLDVLLDAGADIDARSQWWAGSFGLLDSVDADLASYALTRGATMTIHAASRLGRIDTVKEMIAREPSLVHERGGDGQLPLHFASTVEIAEYLLDHGADIEARDLDHESTAAQWMIDERQEIVRYLISRGCKTDILMAAALGDASLVRSHLDAGPECIRLCVSDEYFPMVGKTGGTIYQWKLGWYVRAHRVARKFGHCDVLELLMDRSPAAVRLVDACWEGDLGTVRSLLQGNSTVLGELTPEDLRQIAHAARNNETAVVRLMLETGFPVTATSQHAGMPLHWAAFHGNREMTETILRYDPPLEVPDADHHALPIGWAIYGSQHGWYCNTGDYAGTVELLIAAGVKIPEDVKGSTEVQSVLRAHRGL